MAGVDSNRPLQLAFVDLSLQPTHPLSFGVEHRDLVLHLDQRQAGHALSQQLLEHCLELADDRIEHFGSFVQVRGRLLGGEVLHEHQARGEVRVFLARLAQELAESGRQNLATALGELVDRSLRPLALLLALDGEYPAVALQHLDRVVERAEVQADELVVMTRAHLGGHLIWMHRLLVQQLQDRKSEWREELGLELGGHILSRVYELGYTPSSTRKRASPPLATAGLAKGVTTVDACPGRSRPARDERPAGRRSQPRLRPAADHLFCAQLHALTAT